MRMLAWCHLDRDFASGRDEAERAFDRLAEAGIDTLLPFAYGHGSCWYDSALPGAEKEDRLGPVIEMAHVRHVEVHPVLLPLARVVPLPEADRGRFSFQSGQPGGNPCDGRPCASWQENRDNGIAIVQDILARHPVDGIHLDAIRYTDTGQSLKWPCQCEACKASYREHMGVESLTAEDLTSPGMLHKFLAFRGANIQELMERMVEIAKNRELPLSLAARANYFGSALVEGQDWVQWSRKGWLDYICPMNYSTNRETHRERLTPQMPLLEGTIPVYDGIGRKSSAGTMDARMMIQQTEDALELGAAGIALFQFTALEDEDFGELKALKARVG